MGGGGLASNRPMQPLAGCVKCLGSDVLIMCSTCLLYCAFPDLRFITNVYGGYK